VTKEQALGTSTTTLSTRTTTTTTTTTKSSSVDSSFCLEKRTSSCSHSSDYHHHDDDDILLEELARKAVKHFIMSFPDEEEEQSSYYFPNNDIIQNRKQNSSIRSRILADDRIHGVQVWALPATKGSSVPYHLDYAEYIRYTHNVIVPPLYAGTVQCTPHVLQGGTFAVHMGGLDHYRQHGYKGCLSSKLQNGDVEEMHLGDCGGRVEQGISGKGWVSIPYRFNQGILHSGTLPHLSDKVLDIEGAEKGAKRVIIGFNVFGHGVGEWVQKCPEHSDHFRKMVRMHRWMIYSHSCLSTRTECGDEQTGWTNGERKVICLETIQKNKGLSKLLVLAKRERVKKQWEETQRDMTKWIMDELGPGHGHDEGGKRMTVSELLQKWNDRHAHAQNKSSILFSVSKDDLHVHINNLLKNGMIQSHPRMDENSYDTRIGCGGGLVDLQTVLSYSDHSS
jgi:hypothetical protein